MERSPPSGTTIQSLDKALQLMTCFSPDAPEWSQAELARHLGMPKPTLMRLAHTLEARGFLARTATGKYRLGWTVVRLSEVLLQSLDVRRVAEPWLRRLVATHDETAYLTEWQGGRVHYIMRIDCSHPLKYVLEVGAEAPLHAGSAPKAVAAFLPEHELNSLLTVELPRYTAHTLTDAERLRREYDQIRAQGYATSQSERFEGITGISAPVFGVDGKVIGSVALSIPQQRMYPGRVEEFSADVCSTALAISREMGYTGPQPGGKAP